MIGRLVAGLAVLAGVAVAPASTVSAQATGWYDGVCTDAVGVTVVVDFQDLGGGVNVRCAPGSAANGLDALNRADIAWEPTLRYADFVCRIAGLPTAASEPCGNTPPASAYWSYWSAARGGLWCVNSLGAGNRTPPPGSFEGWSFSLNRNSSDAPAPRFTPPPPLPGQVVTDNCRPAPEPPTTVAVTTTPTAAPAPEESVPEVEATDAPAVAAAAGEPAPATTTAAVTDSTTTTTAAAVAAAPPSTTVVAAPVTVTVDPRPIGTTAAVTTVAPSTTVAHGAVDLSADGRGGGGLGPSTIIGLVLIVVLGGTAALTYHRRRRWVRSTP